MNAKSENLIRLYIKKVLFSFKYLRKVLESIMTMYCVAPSHLYNNKLMRSPSLYSSLLSVEADFEASIGLSTTAASIQNFAV